MSELAVAVPTAGLQAGGAGTTIGRSIVVPKEDAMQAAPLLDRAGRRRSPATTSTFHRGVPPRNKGLRYPADPPTVDEIIAVMRAAGTSPEGVRLRGVIVVLWRAGLRISEALALNETDLDPSRGSLVVRRGLCRIRHSAWLCRGGCYAERGRWWSCAGC
jgi:integrase